MRVAGIVAEYNPFHRGHAYQIAETRRVLGEDTGIVCAMSGNWVQSAGCAVMDKWTRTALALAGGVDLVLELPTVWAISSAEAFAQGAVATLEAAGVVDVLSFGSECGELGPLISVAACLDGGEHNNRIRQALAGGCSYAAARQLAVRAAAGDAADCLSTPNNNLGVEYLRALQSLNSTIQPMTIQRKLVNHGELIPEDGFASATAIRRFLLNGDWSGASAYMVPGAGEFISSKDLEVPPMIQRCERAMLARLRTMEREDFAALPDSGDAEGLPDRLKTAAHQAVSMEDFYTRAKTKRYSHSRLRRLALWSFLQITAADRPQQPLYLRVLGATAQGRCLLRAMEQQAKLPILTKPAHVKHLSLAAQRLFHLEARCTDLYALCWEEIWPCGKEFVTGPVMA